MKTEFTSFSLYIPDKCSDCVHSGINKEAICKHPSAPYKIYHGSMLISWHAYKIGPVDKDCPLRTKR